MAFTDIFKNLGLFKQQGSVVGVDIGGSSIKVVQLRKEKGVAILETYGEMALGPYAGNAVGQAVVLPPDKLVEAMKDLFKEVNITATEATFSVPLRSSLLRLIEIPKVDEKNIDQVVQMEARKYIPVPINEVMLDWLIIPSRDFDGDNKSSAEAPGTEVKKVEKIEVLVVAIHKSMISSYEEIVKKAGLTTSPLEIETFSAARAVLNNDLNAIGVIDVGATSSRLFIIDYGAVRSSHVIDKGSQDITISLQKSLGFGFAEAEEAKRRLGVLNSSEGGDLSTVVSPTLDYIFYEAQKILLAYQKKYSREIAKVILTGGGAQLKGIVELAKRELEIDVELGDSFKKVKVPAIMEKVLAENGSGFSIATGLALRALQ
ncbi:MAG: type IV pilus assembly protein PilM [bacterium]